MKTANPHLSFQHHFKSHCWTMASSHNVRILAIAYHAFQVVGFAGLWEQYGKLSGWCYHEKIYRLISTNVYITTKTRDFNPRPLV